MSRESRPIYIAINTSGSVDSIDVYIIHMRNFGTAALIACSPALVFAGGHGSLGGHGTGVTIDTHVMEG